MLLNERCSVYERYENTPGNIIKELFYYPQWLGRFVCNDDFRIERNDYNSILLIIAKKGEGKLFYRGKSYELKKGNIALINCTDKHTYFPTSEWDFEFMHFYGKDCEKLYEYLYSLSDSAVFSDDGRAYSKLVSILDMFRNAKVNETLISKYISDIFYSLIFSVQKNRSHRCDEICEYIEQNCSLEMSTALLAHRLGFSRAYFSTFFKKSTGVSVSDYLLMCRINRAKLLMSENSLSVSEIAERVGFSEVSSFIRAFRRKEGITPLQYRKKIEG